jgi:hypothetical protein
LAVLSEAAARPVAAADEHFQGDMYDQNSSWLGKRKAPFRRRCDKLHNVLPGTGKNVGAYVT